MSKRTMRWAAFVMLLEVIAVASGITWATRYVLTYPDRPHREVSTSQGEVSVTIPKGSAFPHIVEILEAKQVIDHALSFRMFVHFKGKASHLRAGTYRIPRSITPNALLDMLVKGAPPEVVSVVIPEGKNMDEIATLLDQAGIGDKTSLLREMQNALLLRRIGIPSTTAEGFLFPETYKLQRGMRAQEVVTLLVKQHKRVYADLTARYPTSLKWLRKTLGWGHREIVTMASIIEKETGQAEERPLIASVFMNRLTFEHFQPKLLQTDPTIVYGCTMANYKSPACKQFTGRIRYIHLHDAENPYNTYAHEGLPPGPISNPGRAALQAVFQPTKSRYLFFVAKNDGTHYFSKTQAEHEAAVDKYQR